MPKITVRDELLSIKDLYDSDLTKVVTDPQIPTQTPHLAILQSDIRSLNGIEKLNLTGNIQLTDCLDLESLEGLPSEIAGYLRLKKVGIKSLKGVPTKIGNDFIIDSCAELEELDVLPSYIGGWFSITSRYTLSLSPLKQIKQIRGKKVWLNCRIKNGFLNLFRINMPNFDQLFTLDSESDVSKKMQAMLIEANQNPAHRNRIMLEAQDYLMDSKHHEWATV